MQQPENTTPQVLEEGLWSKTKYMVAKLGRLEKGGKIIGRNKQAQQAAAQVEDVLKKESAKMLQGLVANVQREFPEFPNMESHEDFLGACELYTCFYDSMAAGPKWSPEDQLFIPAVVANAAIVDLRIVWKNFLDYKLSSVYQTMNENAQQGPISGENNDSTTINTLKSNKLPMLLAGLGSSLGAFGWILKTPFMQEWLNNLFNHTQDIAQYVSGNEVLGSIGNGEGVTQFLHRLYPGVDISPNAPVANFQKLLATVGNGNQDAGLKSLSGILKNPEKVGELKQMLASGKYHTMKELFNQAQDNVTSGRGGSWFETVKNAQLSVGIKQQIIKTVATQAVKVGAVGAGIGSFLAPLGIGLVAAGVTTKLLRMKGLKSSRAQIMNDLLVSWVLLEDADAGSQAMKSLGAGSQETGVATNSNQETGVGAANTQDQEPQTNGLPKHQRRFNSDAEGIEDAQVVDDNGIGTGPAQVGGDNSGVDSRNFPPELQKFAQNPLDSQERVNAYQFVNRYKTTTDPTLRKSVEAVEALLTKTDAQSNQETSDFFTNFAKGAGGDSSAEPTASASGTAPDRGADGAATVTPNAPNPLLTRLDPDVDKNAEANLKAFGDTITTADKRNPQEIEDEISYLKYAVKEIPAQVIMPKVKALQAQIKAKDAATQLKAVRAFRSLSAYFKNLYVSALKNYSEDTATILQKDMSYTGTDGLKKKEKPEEQTAVPKGDPQQTQLPLNESYSTPLFNAAEGKEDMLLGTLTQTLPKLIRQLETGQALSTDQQRYLIQKLSVGTYSQKPGRKDMEPGLAQKIIKEINKWLLIRIKDYQAYIKYIQGPKPKATAKQATEPINESLNPFLVTESVETGLNPFLLKESINPFLTLVK